MNEPHTSERRLSRGALYAIIGALLLALALVLYSTLSADIEYEARIPYGQNVPSELVKEDITYMGAKGNRLEFVTPNGERSYTAIGAEKGSELPLTFLKHKTYVKDFSNEYVTLVVYD